MIYTKLISSPQEEFGNFSFQVPLSVAFRIFYYAPVATASELEDLYVVIKLYNTNDSNTYNEIRVIPNFSSDGNYTDSDGMHYCSGLYKINNIEPFNKVSILTFSPIGMYKTFETSTLPFAF